MVGTPEGAAKRERCKCGAFLHSGPCPTRLGAKYPNRIMPPGITRDRPARDLMERVWEKIAVGEPDECWEWQAYRNPSGYGQITLAGGGRRYPHRLVIDAQPGEVVLHACDNPPCCNPAHLSASTQADNMRDMVEKGRQQAGEVHWNVRLTAEQVAEILADPRSSSQVAADYGVSSGTIRKIRRGERWKSLEG